MSAATADTIDLADVARSLRSGWRVILASVAIGGVIALLVVAFGPRRFSATASAVVRTYRMNYRQLPGIEKRFER